MPTVNGPPPTPGDIHVRAIPARAEEPLVIRIVFRGEEARSSETFATGEVVAFDLTDFPGEHGFTVNGVACTGTFTVQPVLEVDVVMNLTEAGCHIAPEGLHAPGAIDHGGD
jgi:hypothetical protein